MSPRPRLLLALAALMLGLVYVLPLWRVTLEAPQYPGGIGMLIRVNTITGLHPHDLQNINGLNHYIGMKPIVPDAIPELRWMPALFGGLLALGLLAALVGRRWALYGWTALFALLLAVGFVDYYRWGYDYGHDLSPDAAIKVPGMSYQPPIIGSKTILNFTAHSWPDTGGVVVFLAFALAVGLSVAEFRRARRPPPPSAGAPEEAPAEMEPAGIAPPPAPVRAVLVPLRCALACGVRSALTCGVLALLAWGCSPGPVPLRYGEDACAHCRMIVSDPAFGAELVAATGRTYPFDSVECLTAFVRAHPEVRAHALWVTPADAPGTLVRVYDAYFLRSPGVRSPMGGGLAAFRSPAARDAARAESDGEALDWPGVLAATDPATAAR